MSLNSEFRVFDWFRIHFIENNGMAYGLELGGDYGKLLLTLFRIIVVGWGVFYVNKLLKENKISIAVNTICQIHQ